MLYLLMLLELFIFRSKTTYAQESASLRPRDEPEGGEDNCSSAEESLNQGGSRHKPSEERERYLCRPILLLYSYLL